ncbi:hypothetical protein LIT25_07105 [Bacillus sp. F19]|nr:hypothetical protein LIT25_07105 [Bacillus sp. F19]
MPTSTKGMVTCSRNTTTSTINSGHIHDVIVIYKNDAPVACGAFKEYDRETIELNVFSQEKRVED